MFLVFWFSLDSDVPALYDTFDAFNYELMLATILSFNSFSTVLDRKSVKVGKEAKGSLVLAKTALMIGLTDPRRAVKPNVSS